MSIISLHGCSELFREVLLPELMHDISVLNSQGKHSQIGKSYGLLSTIVGLVIECNATVSKKIQKAFFQRYTYKQLLKLPYNNYNDIIIKTLDNRGLARFFDSGAHLTSQSTNH